MTVIRPLLVTGLTLLSLPAIASDTDSTLRKMLPPAILANQVIQGGSSLTTPPLYTFAEDGKTASGVLIDLINNAATYLGVKVEWQQVPYGTIIPAMDAGRVQISGSQFSATEENLKRANIISIYKNTVALVVPSAEVGKFKDLDSACGLTIAVVRGSTIEAQALALIDAACEKAGKPSSRAAVYAGSADALIAVKAGRAAGFLLSLSPAQYMSAKTPGLSTVFAGRFAVYSSGFAVAKQYGGIAKALSEAINRSIADGSYGAIMRRWNMPDILFAATSTVNDPSN